MRNRILSVISLLAIFFALFSPLCAQAITPLDPDAEASLTVSYQKDGTAFPDLTVGIYRVAKAFPNGEFELIAPFSSYPVSIYDIIEQEQWTNAANTLYGYIVSNQIVPDAEAVTNAEGLAVFANLETGLYLVEQIVAENANGTYIFNRFMVYLPTPQADGSYLYDVKANPKCVSFVPKTEYKVTKLWQDAGHQNDRPEEVLIDIYKDGVLQDTQPLNAANNWSYIWYVSEDDPGSWTVVERSVDSMYTVSVRQNSSCFSIINTHTSNLEKPDSPQTGDTSNLMLYVIMMCVSGIMLIILGIYSRRRNGE